MSNEIREHVGIAIDGGGIKGAIVAEGLIELEQMLGVDRLIDSPKLKVIAGTSTGALIAGSIAAGMSGTEILSLYRSLGEAAFAKSGPLRPFGRKIPVLSQIPLPPRVVRFIDRLPLGDIVVYALLPARYSFDPLRRIMRKTLADHPVPNNDPTLEAVGNFLRTQHHGPTVIITAAEVSARRTHFLKTVADEKYRHMKFIEAMLASSCIPTYFPPIALPSGDTPTRWLVDGGVGSFGNPALVVAWEMCDPHNPDPARHYDPNHTTVFSFGTGTLLPEVYRAHNGDPSRWWALKWVSRVMDVFIDTAIREQSRSLVCTYPGIDLRRFQVALPKPISADRFDLLDTILHKKGLELRELMRENRHALNPDPDLRYDPEGIWHSMLSGRG
jgi:predicted acylesterase/phospholipase RssA